MPGRWLIGPDGFFRYTVNPLARTGHGDIKLAKGLKNTLPGRRLTGLTKDRVMIADTLYRQV